MHLTKPARHLAVALALAVFTPSLALAGDAAEPDAPTVPVIDRISWSAVLAGLVVAVATYMTLSTLGIGIGTATVDPRDEVNPAKGVPTTILAWMFVSGLVALFVGGWVSGRLADTVPFASAAHGVLTWALAMVVMFCIANTSIGHLVGGTARLLGGGGSTAARAAAPAVPEVVAQTTFSRIAVWTLAGLAFGATAAAAGGNFGSAYFRL